MDNVPLAGLPHGALDRIGTNLCRAYPALETRAFDELLTAIDASDEQMRSTRAKSRSDRILPPIS